MGAGGYQSFSATYCEWCGEIVDASDEFTFKVSKPAHRVDFLDALNELDEGPVGESTALERGTCECGGQIVHRAYTVGEVPECEYEPDEDQIRGRDPDEDALIDLSPIGEGLKEVREVSWIDEESDNNG